MSFRVTNATPPRISQRTASRNALTDQRCDDLLRRLGLELGLGVLTFDQHRDCFLMFDDVVIHLRHRSGEQLEMSSIIAVLAQPAPADLLAQLLAANVYSQDQSRGTLALEPERGVLLLQNRMPIDQAELSRVLASITAMVDCVEQWRRRLPAVHARVPTAV